jgi:folate-binding protein YgfZ
VPESFDLGRDVIAVSGPDSAAYLQGQLSQDVIGLFPGSSAWSWLLAPNGKVDALLRVTRLEGDAWLLDTDGGWGERTRARLERFRLRTKVDFAATDHAVVRVLGPGAAAPAAVAVLVPAWPGLDAADAIGATVPPSAGGPDDYEPHRILAGIPRMGAELDERTIPAEAGIIDATVSFTKGCYTGQELVARVDSRGGNVPRHLARLRSAGTLIAGTELQTPAGDPAGAITSAAADPAGGGWVALGFVRRAVSPSAVLMAAGQEVQQL